MFTRRGQPPGPSSQDASCRPKTTPIEIPDPAVRVPRVPRVSIVPKSMEPATPSGPESPSAPRRLVVGREVGLRSDIGACDDLLVEGRLETSRAECCRLEVREFGSFKGDAMVDDCELSGRFEGDLVVRNRLVLRSTGSITGDLKYGELEIEPGGRVIGAMDVFESQTLALVPPVESGDGPVEPDQEPRLI